MLPLSFRLQAARRYPSPRRAVLGQWEVAQLAMRSNGVTVNSTNDQRQIIAIVERHSPI
jgi:hypothetical protein